MARPTRATYRRRRLVALAMLAGVVLAAVAALGGLGGGGSPLSAGTPQQLRKEALAQHPVHLTIEASGDILIHTLLWERAQALAGGSGYDFAPMFREIKPYVAGSDLALCHVETPMTSAPPTSYPIFNTPPDLAKGIAATGWDACDTASNHSLDQGQDGIDQTGRALDKAGVEHAGSYPSPTARRRLVIMRVHGIKIAFLAYTTDTNGIPVPHPWSVNIASPKRILSDAHRAVAAGADAVVVNLHWGGEILPEYQVEPSSGQIDLVKRLTASPDITAIVGQGPHAVQPIERVNGKYVVFSEGNLVSNQSPAYGLPASSQDGMVVLLSMVVDAHGAKVTGVKYVPVFVRVPDYTVEPVGPALKSGALDAATAQDSYQRTVSVVGHGHGVEPIPAHLSGR